MRGSRVVWVAVRQVSCVVSVAHHNVLDVTMRICALEEGESDRDNARKRSWKHPQGIETNTSLRMEEVGYLFILDALSIVNLDRSSMVNGGYHGPPDTGQDAQTSRKTTLMYAANGK